MTKNSYGLADVVVARTNTMYRVGLEEYRGDHSTTIVDTLVFNSVGQVAMDSTRLVVGNEKCLDGDEWFAWACKWLERKHAESAAALKIAEDVLAISRARNDMFEAMLADVDRNAST